MACSMQVFDEEDEVVDAERRQHIVVIRHGNRMQPTCKLWLDLSRKHPYDIPLSPGHEQQCKAKANEMPDVIYGLVAISPFKRCAQTAAALIPYLQLAPDCEIFFHKGLSEVHKMEFMFPRQQEPSMTQRYAFWRWRSKRNGVLPEYASIGGHAVQKQVLGHWPELGEQTVHAQNRFVGVFDELVDMAHGRNILVISHAEAVEQAVHWAGSSRSVSNVDPLGFCQASRVLGDLNQAKAQQRHTSEWKLLQPPMHGPDSKCGVQLVPERSSVARCSDRSKWNDDRLREEERTTDTSLAMSSNPWWAMTD